MEAQIVEAHRFFALGSRHAKAYRRGPNRQIGGSTGEVAWGVRVWTSDGIAADPKWTRTVEQVESGFRPKEMNECLAVKRLP
jgi:hypothetical protein